jgi:hypothetical protein
MALSLQRINATGLDFFTKISAYAQGNKGRTSVLLTHYP